MELWNINYALEFVPPRGKGAGLPYAHTRHYCNWGWDGPGAARHVAACSHSYKLLARGWAHRAGQWVQRYLGGGTNTSVHYRGFPEIADNPSLTFHYPGLYHVVLPSCNSSRKTKSLFRLVIWQRIITKE